jgi:large subunit ribosomal protein L24e
MYVRNDSKAFRFCSSKCDKAFKKKKNPRRTAWTKAFRKAHGKEMATDATLAFERKRNVPTKTNKDLIQRTIRAIDRVEEIKARRQLAFYKKRIETAQIRNSTAADLRELRMHTDMLPKEERHIAVRALEQAAAHKAARERSRVSVTQDAEMELEPEAPLPVETPKAKAKAGKKALTRKVAERVAE